MSESISQNAIEFGVSVSNQDALSKLMSDMNKLKGIDMDNADPFKGIKQSAQKATEDVNKMTGSIKNNRTALNDGAKGASAFTSKLKEIKKVSFEKLKSGAAAFATKLKEAANVSFEKLKSGLKSVQSALGNGAKKAAGYVVKGTAVAAAGVGALVASSVNAYADTEQLIGGVETLFKGSAGAVLNNANSAFKTTGLSANEYMDTVTSFSASLISSLKGDTEKAAALSNQALVDMSDNANKMGTDMASIQNAYQGFAKQNYTMLDNLKLGYGGTQEEMKRLLKDASALKKAQGKNVNYSINKFADIVEAIHTVQENMDITGTTMKEAESTISGSLNMLKASWKDTLSSLVSGDGDFDRCIDNLIYSAERFGDNVIPAIEKALGGVGKLIERGAPIIADKFPTLAQNLLPPLIKAAAAVVSGFIKALPTLLDVIVRELPGVFKELGNAVADTFGDAFPILKTFGNFISQNSDKISNCIPVIIGLALAFKGFNTIKSAGSGLMAFISPLKALKDRLSGGIGEKLKNIANGTRSAGETAQNASGGLASSARGFLSMGASVLLVCVGLALLAQSAIALANAGPLAIGVMLGLVAVIAGLAAGAAALGTALTAGAVGFIAFGAAMLLVGAGALLAALGLSLIAPTLPIVAEYGLSGALAIAALGGSLIILAAGTIAAAAGVAAFAIALVAAVVPLAAIVAPAALAAAAFIPLLAAVSGLSDKMGNAASGTLTMTAALSDLSAIAVVAFAALKTTASQSCDKLNSLCKKCADKIKKTFSSLDLSKSGKNAMQGLISGMESKRSAVISKAKDIAKAAAKAINDALDIHSPSRVTMASGEFAILGLAEGIQNKQAVLERTTASVASSGISPIDSALAAYSQSDRGASVAVGSDDITIAPVFNLTINGAASDDDRQAARKVRSWVKDEFENILNSMNRRSARTQYI
nr:MAG TPA: tail tape measure protein [Bacteriophage sp.]